MAKTNVRLSDKAKRSANSRHNWTLQWCWNYERMQASGFAYSMVPVIKELYDNEEEQCIQLERHMQFYNTHPGASSVIMGAAVALEENYQTETSDSLKVGLMGPFAGIGDTIQAVLVTPPASIIAASLAANGNWLSILVSWLPIFLLFVVRWPLFNWGYNRSVGIIEDVSGASGFADLQVMASILGLTVIGGFIPDILKGLTLKYEFKQALTDETTGEVVEKVVRIQDSLDGILPYLLPIVVTAFCYWMIKHRKVSPIRAILYLAVLMFALGALGIM